MPDDILFFDFETRSKVDLKSRGTPVYAADDSTRIICMSVASLKTDWSGVYLHPDFTPPKWTKKARKLLKSIEADVPTHFNDHVRRGGYVAASNSSFDRAVGRYHGKRFGIVPPELDQVLCVQTLAESYSCPGSLEGAAKVLKAPVKKNPIGKKLKAMFCNANAPWPDMTVDANVDMLAMFLVYCHDDSLASKGVWERCRPWSAEEWQDFHVIERMNDRGQRVDADFASAAAELGAAEKAELETELKRLSGDRNMKFTTSQRKAKFVGELVRGTPLEPLMTTKKSALVSVGEKKKRVQKETVGLAAPVQDAMSEMLGSLVEQHPDGWIPTEDGFEFDARLLCDFLAVLEQGRGVATAKYAKMLHMVSADGRLRNQYRCSATLTGRHTSRGVQLDNVKRDTLHDPDDAIEAIIEAGEKALEALKREYGLSGTEVLGRLLRSTNIADEGNALIWVDLKQGEARIMRWLADADEELEPYIRGDDPYIHAAAKLHNTTYDKIAAGVEAGDKEAKRQRLKGKVSELALGYQGGGVALCRMAASYRLPLTLAQGEEIKRAWRRSNRWAVHFWKKLMKCALRAMRRPGKRVDVTSRLFFLFNGADLHMFLPDGRPIVYPEARLGEVHKPDWGEDVYVETIFYRKMYQKNAVRGELYGGLICENATQGTLASVLRDKLRKLDDLGLCLIGSTHDEAKLEVQVREVKRTMHVVKKVMRATPAWAKGLPLDVDADWGFSYGK